jgi:hypothetical protein
VASLPTLRFAQLGLSSFSFIIGALWTEMCTVHIGSSTSSNNIRHRICGPFPPSICRYLAAAFQRHTLLVEIASIGVGSSLGTATQVWASLLGLLLLLLSVTGGESFDWSRVIAWNCNASSGASILEVQRFLDSMFSNPNLKRCAD